MAATTTNAMMTGGENANMPNLISKQAYERRQKREQGHQPWASSKKMHYLRLSKGRRKPTGQEIAMSNQAMSTMDARSNFRNSGGFTGMATSHANSANRINENFSISASQALSKGRVFKKYGPEAFCEEL